MKAILEFDCPEQEQELQTAIDGYKWKFVVSEIDRQLRNQSKYEDVETISIDSVRKIITDVINDYGLKEE